MKLVRPGILATLAGASLLLGGSVTHASTASDLTASLIGTLSPLTQGKALLPNVATLQTQLASLVRDQVPSGKYLWEQVAISENCVGGGTSCIGPNQTLVGDLTLAVVDQIGFTNTNGGAPLEASAACERVHLTSPGNGTITLAQNQTGTLLASTYSGVESSGAVRLINAAPSSTAAVAADASDFSTWVSSVQRPSTKTANASTLVTGSDVTDNTRSLIRGGALKLTLTGPVKTSPITNGETGTGTVAPGSVSCAVQGNSVAEEGANVLVPAP
jgi:hypothetical protein